MLDILRICIVFALSAAVTHWPPCANLTLFSNGVIDLQSMLFNCSANIPAALVPPSYFTLDPYYSPTNVTFQLALNNLINVDDLTSQVELDFYLRLSWVDPRVNLESIWPYLNPECNKDGIDITQYVRNQDPLNFWLPDIVFTDSTDNVVISELIKLQHDGAFYWSRHLFLTIAQPQMSFYDFPSDVQNFSIRMQSYSFGSKILVMKKANPAVLLLFDLQQGQYNVKMSELWTYDSYSAYTTDELFPTFYNPTRIFTTGYVNIKFTRQPLGVIFRLALPVTIFLVIVGLSFWADIDKRIEVTLQMLLVVAALYLIVGQEIPFVGYLTTMDNFITATFVLLSITIGVHFFTQVIDRKKDKYPLNLFFRDFLEFFFRLIWIPLAFLLFIVMFRLDNVPIFISCIIASIASALQGMSKIPYLKKSFMNSTLSLREKVKAVEAYNTGMHNKGSQQNKFAENSESLWLQRLTPIEQRWLRFTRSMYVSQKDKAPTPTTHRAANGVSTAGVDDSSRVSVSGGVATVAIGRPSENPMRPTLFTSRKSSNSAPSRKSLDDIVDSDDDDDEGNGGGGGASRSARGAAAASDIRISISKDDEASRFSVSDNISPRFHQRQMNAAGNEIELKSIPRSTVPAAGNGSAEKHAGASRFVEEDL